MSYELQVYALSPVRPTPRELLARTADSGLEVELAKAPGTSAADDAAWTKLLLRAAGPARGGFLVEASPDLDRMKLQFRQDRADGEEIPDEVLDASRLYVLELDDDAPGGEEHQAAFVVTAWALAALTEAIVFDPQEEFFADAESFWGIINDESMGDGREFEDEPGEGHDHEGGCCSGPALVDIDVGARAARPDAPGRERMKTSERTEQRRSRE